MIPVELEPEYRQLPETDQHTMVIITGSELRHRRFAYRLQQEFGDRVIAWYEIDHNISIRKPVNDTRERQAGLARQNSKLAVLNRSLVNRILRNGLITAITKAGRFVFRTLNPVIADRNVNKHVADPEMALFAREIGSLKECAHLNAIKIQAQKVHHPDFIDEIKRLDPYFFLSLGGPLYNKQLLESIRGVAINQHAGHSPDLKGTKTIEWALYHRRLDLVSSTVHITCPGADSGPILRRSNPCLFPEDDPHTIFARVVALGTELMIESVREIINNKQVMIFKQPKTAGKSYLDKDYVEHISKSISRDFDAGWLRHELHRLRSF
jgi:methionyl-tRNA formyltransferase